MSLAPGARLGPYEILAAIGAGGMGEVYRARDSRLGRDVALKVLPSAFSADPERLHRFEQEAQAAAALNHPNILAVHDIGTHDGAPYIVAELLEGETLRDRLSHGPLSVRRAVEYAIQVTRGLAAAHEKGIVHRDLKPENIFITNDGRAKILDFGLAKLTHGDPIDARPSSVPTTPVATERGMVLGTMGYMAPEQVRGLPADYRADIFAFGAVLYEMLSGQRAFRGSTAADTMTAILKEDPPDLPAADRHIPSMLERIVERCLEKNPAARFQSTADLAFALEAISAHSGTGPLMATLPPAAQHRRRAWIFVALLSAGLAAALMVAAGAYFLGAPQDTRTYRSSLLLPANVIISDPGSPSRRLAISPDGRRLAFTAAGPDGRILLWVRPLDSLVAQPLAGTEDAFAPFWSPDSRFIGFFAGVANGKLKKIDASGGPPLTLCDFPAAPSSASWGRDDVILFALAGGGGPIRRVSASGGLPSMATTPDTKAGETEHWMPFFLPDGKDFLYLALGQGSRPLGIYVTSLDSSERKLLVSGGSNAKYAQGYLLFLRESTLMAQAFDLRGLELRGDAVPIAEQVQVGGGSGATGAFSVSENGVLAYQIGAAGTTSELVWFDRAGKQIDVLGDRADYGDLELSPDGKRAAVSLFDPARKTRDIWLYDVARGLRTRFTFDPADEFSSTWSPDGSRVVFASRRKGHFDLYQKASSGAGNEDTLFADDLNKLPVSWSADGRFVLYFGGPGGPGGPAAGNDLWVLPLVGDRKPFPFLQTPFNESSSQFSPDGRWIAYTSNESGRAEVYVAPFPGPGGKWQISTASGTQARWKRDGTEIFYLAPDNKLMAATVNGRGSGFEVGAVRPLFETRQRPLMRNSYAVSADGQRFLVNTLAGQATAMPITLVVNWVSELKQ